MFDDWLPISLFILNRMSPCYSCMELVEQSGDKQAADASSRLSAAAERVDVSGRPKVVTCHWNKAGRRQQEGAS
jgi:hypothetical protein